MRLCLHALGPRSGFSIIRPIIVKLRQNDVTRTATPKARELSFQPPRKNCKEIEKQVIVRYQEGDAATS